MLAFEKPDCGSDEVAISRLVQTLTLSPVPVSAQRLPVGGGRQRTGSGGRNQTAAIGGRDGL
jgi:hypothetical protein